MKPSELKQRFAAGEVLLGLAHTFASPALTELLAGYCDFLWIDGQHGEFSEDKAQQAVRIAGLVGTATLLRVASDEPGLLGRYADMAPSAIMAPMVQSTRQAAAIASALRYPPHGQRSFGGRRVIDLYGRTGATQEEPLLIVQIETREALNEVEAIGATPGVAGLFFGPDDLRLQMGIPLDAPILENTILVDALTRLAAAARRSGIVAATVAGSPEMAHRLMDMGYQMLVIGSDIGCLRQAAGLGERFRRVGHAGQQTRGS